MEGSIILNLIVFIIGVVKFHKTVKTKKLSLISLSLLYLTATLIVFLVVLAIQHDYIDGLFHIVSSIGSLVLFWLYTTVYIVYHNIKLKTYGEIFFDTIQLVILIVIPTFLWFWIQSAGDLKPGG